MNQGWKFKYSSGSPAKYYSEQELYEQELYDQANITVTTVDSQVIMEYILMLV